MPTILTANDAAVIKQRLLEGASVKDLALLYAVARETIRRIGRGETWAHVPAGEVAPAAEHPHKAEPHMLGLEEGFMARNPDLVEQHAADCDCKVCVAVRALHQQLPKETR